MCGIAGIADFSGAVDDSVVAAMCDAMVHRGPDAGGIHSEDGVCLGARRLAIIDLAGGHQPISNEDGSIVVVMNGEIYNHATLRSNLLSRGHVFRSRVDTEVLVHLYEDEGDELIHHLQGMFAFALWDRRRRRLLCARDRVGKKPLYWTRRGERITFASELWALLQDHEIERRVDPAGVCAYLTYQYVPHELTAIRGVRKLPPAGRLVADRQGVRIDQYWTLSYAKPTPATSAPEAAEATRELVMNATRRRLISEVPLGAFLSGGVDSSVVVGCMACLSDRPIRTFSISFEEADFNEVHYARQVANQFGTDHHEFVVQPGGLSIMAKMARHYGEPYADPSAVPSFYLAELTRQYVTVALNGDGGDESFGGYGRYGRGQLIRRLQRIPFAGRALLSGFAEHRPGSFEERGSASRVFRMLRALSGAPADAYLRTLMVFDAPARSRLLKPEFLEGEGPLPEEIVRRDWDQTDATDVLDRMMSVDIRTYLPDDLLVKMDIATMASSVEARSPLLDHEVMEFAAALPPDLKRRGSESKIALKDAFRDLIPAEILQRKKMGFGVPLDRWFRQEMAHLPQEVLLDPASSSRDYLRLDEVERMIREHAEGRTDHSLRLWTLLQLEMWHREVVDAPRPRSDWRSRSASEK